MDTKVKIISMDEIQAEEIKWLWKPYIPFGKLTIIQGDPGEGKTTFVLRLAAQLSQGKGFDESMEITEPMNVIYQTAVDGLADTVKPRLLSANAECSRIKVIDDTEKSLYMDDERLEIAIREQNAKLLILDPLQAYLGDRVDMNRANEAREMTKKLSAMAERTGCAVILVGHMNKGSGAKAAYRGIGSIDFLPLQGAFFWSAEYPMTVVSVPLYKSKTILKKKERQWLLGSVTVDFNGWEKWIFQQMNFYRGALIRINIRQL